MADCIRLACESTENTSKISYKQQEQRKLVTPGELIDTGFQRGHGTYEVDQDLYASVAGVVRPVGTYISVKPLKARYNGEIGDRIVGRITEVQQKRWKVDTSSRLDSILNLSLNILPSGESRRRCAEDELMMRQYLKEGDLISAEVHQIYNDGSLSLSIKNLKHGKLSQGTLVRVSPSVVKRCKLHIHHLPYGVTIILGNNGWIWIAVTTPDTQDQSNSLAQNLEPVQKDDRETVARVRNLVLALANSRIMLYDTSINFAYEESLKYLQVKDLLKPDVIADIAEMTRHRLAEMEM